MSRLPAILALLVPLATRVTAAGPEVDASQLPRVPATPPEKALNTFKVKPGFRLELVAAEPLVVDPIALGFDEDGRCYVVEMRDYSERRPERLGRIRRLEDTDGDGRFDKGVVFAADLPWPTAVICWDGGVFVGATPDILYFKDTNGDGVADVREPVFTGFAADYAPFATNKLNVQALMNSFNWSLDNRIHGATSFNGGKVRRVDSPFVRGWLQRAGSARNAKLETRNDALDLRGRDFSFDPRTLEMRAESGGGQYGMSFDDRGRKFVCSNSSHLQALMYEDRYAARNPYASLPRALVDIAVDGGAAPVFRISPDEPWRVIRTQWRVSGVVPGPIEGGGRPSGYFTGATGITIYRGDAFPPEFVGNAFVGDAGGNLVHRKRILSDGADLKGVRPADEETVEFLASTDNWFRPVQMANAPDGCLYLCDMYREVIEHPWSLPESIKKHLDLNSGNDRGRLYRVEPENFKQPKRRQLGNASTKSLVEALTLANGWHRDTAARLLYQRQDKSAGPLLTKLLAGSQVPVVRVHALYALSGLGALDEKALMVGLADASPDVRAHAVRLAETPLASARRAGRLEDKLVSLASDTNEVVRRQLAFTLGYLPREWRVKAAVAMVQSRPLPGCYPALFSSIGDEAGELFQRLAADDRRLSNSEVFSGLASRMGASNRSNEVDLVLQSLNRAVTEAKASGQEPLSVLAIAASLGRGLDRAGGSLSTAERELQLKPIFALARRWATQPDRREGGGSGPAAGDPRGDALAVLGYAPYHEAASTLFAVVEKQPTDSARALAALGRFVLPDVADRLLGRWPRLSPQIRSEALGLLLKRPERIRSLLGFMEGGAVQRQELSAAQSEFLRAHKDQGIRERAQRLLGGKATGSRQSVVAAFQPALQLRGATENGRKIFQSRCVTCHKLGNEGNLLGPDLATVKNGGKEKLLTSILDPSREVNSNYLGYVVEKKDGESLSGLIVNENANSVTVRMAGGAETVVARANIASMQSQGRSLMPEGLEEGLSVQDMADLLEFILAP